MFVYRNRVQVALLCRCIMLSIISRNHIYHSCMYIYIYIYIEYWDLMCDTIWFYDHQLSINSSLWLIIIKGQFMMSEAARSNSWLYIVTMFLVLCCISSFICTYFSSLIKENDDLTTLHVSVCIRREYRVAWCIYLLTFLHTILSQKPRRSKGHFGEGKSFHSFHWDI